MFYGLFVRNPALELLQINRKLEKWQCRHKVIVNFFWRFYVSLAKFSYWSQSHVSIVTVSGVMTISFYKGFTRNLEIGNTPVWVLPNIWRQGNMSVSNKMLLNAAKYQVYSFYRFWVIKRIPTVWGKIAVLPQMEK